MEIVIKSTKKFDILNYIGHLCGDLFPEGIAVDYGTGTDCQIITFENGQVIKLIPDPTVDIYVELSNDIIALASVERHLTGDEHSTLDMFINLDRLTKEQRAEVTAIRRFAAAESRPFSMKVSASVEIFCATLMRDAVTVLYKLLYGTFYFFTISDLMIINIQKSGTRVPLFIYLT